MSSPRFLVVSEGPTDVAVIRRVLAGHFGDANIRVARLPEPGAVATNPDDLGGWGNVLSYIASPLFEDAFQSTDFIVVHIDADKCEEFGVSPLAHGKRLSDRDIADLMANRLRAQIGEAWMRVGEQTIFAIAVDSTECWLLAHHSVQSVPAASLNCFARLSVFVSKTNPLRIKGLSKEYAKYDRLASPLGKTNELRNARGRNASLALFLEEVERVTQA